MEREYWKCEVCKKDTSCTCYESFNPELCAIGYHAHWQQITKEEFEEYNQ